MKFSVLSLVEWPRDPSRETAHQQDLERLVEAESQGCDGAWLTDDPTKAPGLAPALHPAVAALAARTSRVRIGVWTRLPASFHPLRLAEEIALLDLVSGGRLDWALAPTGPDGLAVFEEQLAVCRRAFTGERFAHRGERFAIPELQCLPRPEQHPHPPLSISCDSPETVRWAAHHDWPVLDGPFATVEELEATRRAYREAGGVDVGRHEHPVVRRIHVGERDARAREEVEAAGADVLVGDAAACRDGIAELRDRTGCTHLIAWQRFARIDPESARASQRRLLEKVAPGFA